MTFGQYRDYDAVMTSEQLVEALAELGLKQNEAARRLNVRAETVSRWIGGTRKVPGPVEAAVEAWLREHRQGRANMDSGSNTPNEGLT